MELSDIMHMCKYLNTDIVYIHKELDPATQKDYWILTILREANEDDLQKSSVYENIGDEVWRFESEISYCPYCGEKLNEPKNITCLEDTRTTITDSSVWYSKKL